MFVKAIASHGIIVGHIHQWTTYKACQFDNFDNFGQKCSMTLVRKSPWQTRASDLVEVAVKGDGTATGVNQRATPKCSENSEMLCQSVESVSQNILERNDLCWCRSCPKFCSVGHPLLYVHLQWASLLRLWQVTASQRVLYTCGEPVW